MKRYVSLIISFVIGILIVYYLLSAIDPTDIPRAISKIPLTNLSIAFLMYALSVFVKSLRFNVILSDTRIGLWRMFNIVSLYMFFANFLPMRAGELSYLVLMKRTANTSGTASLASLIIGGIADVTLVLIAMVVVGWHFRHLIKGKSIFDWAYNFVISLSSRYLKTAIALSIVLSIVLFLVVKLRERFKLWERIAQVIEQLKSVTFNAKIILVIILSLAIISLRFLSQWIIVYSMKLGIGIWEFSFALLFGTLLSLLPVHGPSGFGTVEAPWVLALLYLGIPKDDAIVSGFALHILVVLFSIIIGVYGFITTYLGGIKKKEGQERCLKN